MKKRLLHIITGLNRGGAEAVLYQLLKKLDSTYFEHTVIYFYPGSYVEKIQKLPVKTYHITGLISTYDPIFIYKLFKIVKEIKPNYIHTLLWSANFLGRMLGSWYNITHVEVFHNNIDQNGFIRNFLDRITAKYHGHIVAVSDGVAQSLNMYAPWLTKPNIKIIKNGIPTHEQENVPTISRQELGLLPSHFLIGSVGRFELIKNHSLLLTAFALLYDKSAEARLMLIGSGSQEYALKKRAYDLGIDDRVIFIVGQDAQSYYNIFDCFVMTSYKEGLSIALLEAMNHEIAPIVFSSNEYHDVIIDQQNGLLIHHTDAQELANTIDLLMNNEMLRKNLGEEAKITVQNKFTIDTMINEYNLLYKSIDQLK